MDYLQLIQKTIDIIEYNILEEINVSDLARSAFCSRFHYQRLFHAIVGNSVMNYIKKRRLSLAAKEIVSTNSKVIDIALKYGYSSHEAFSRAFKTYHKVSPFECRKSGLMNYCKRVYVSMIKNDIERGVYDMIKFEQILNYIDEIKEVEKKGSFVFNIDDEIFGIDILSVIEITKVTNITHYENATGFLIGSIFLRGWTIPVIDLGELLKKTSCNNEEDACIIICKNNLNDEFYGIGYLISKKPDICFLSQECVSFNNGLIMNITNFNNDKTEETNINILDYRKDINEAIKSLDMTKIKGSNNEVNINKSTILKNDNKKIIHFINECSNEIDYLALNASIEALHTMSKGGSKGHFIIAHELKILANKLSNGSKEIINIL